MYGIFPSGGWLSLGWWVPILWLLGDHPRDGGWPSMAVVPWSWFCELRVCATFYVFSIFPCGGWPSYGGLVTIYGSCPLVLLWWDKGKCQIPSLWYTSFWWVTILWLVGDHPRDCGWPSMAIVTLFWFCEVSLSDKFWVCSIFSSSRWPSMGCGWPWPS